MAPMPSNHKASPTNANFLYVTNINNANNSPTPSSPPSSSIDAAKSQCSSMSEGESFEGYGENDLGGIHLNHSARDRGSQNSTNVTANGVELELAPHGDKMSTPQQNDELNILPRDNWARRSLRRTPNNKADSLNSRRWGSMRHTGRRQLASSNGLACHLYRSSSFNSSGRSSNCDNTEDMYSDISLDNVQDISYKLELLQRQVTDLADTQNNIAEDRSTRTKTEYAVLQARYHMLEDQFREAELRAEERLAEEQKRYRELLARMERETSLQNENCQIKIKTIEVEANTLREENQRLRILCDKQANDIHRIEEKVESLQDHIIVLQQDLDDAKQLNRKHEQEKKSAEDLMIDLSKELERVRAEMGPALPATSPESIRLDELHQELEQMRERNKILQEQNEELQAVVLTRGVEEGRHLLNGAFNSLAQELEEMSQAQDSVDSTTLASLSQLQQAFQEKEEENTRLKHYIDTILLNIVENYPQLLEVKSIDKK